MENKAIQGQYITLDTTGDQLTIRLTPEGRNEMLNLSLAYCVTCACYHRDHVTVATCDSFLLPEGEIYFRKTHSDILAELFEDIQANSSWLVLSEHQYEDIGALTSSPIIVSDHTTDDEGTLEVTGAVYWFPNYQLESELETLLRQGSVSFAQATEDNPAAHKAAPFVCAICSKEFETVGAAMNCEH